MANCKDDFLKETKGKTVLCSIIVAYPDHYDGEQKKEATLPVGYSESEMLNFLEAINYQYDSGYGSQEVYGTIWYTDGTWSERGEYDGSEWWEYKTRPEIPKELQAP